MARAVVYIEHDGKAGLGIDLLFNVKINNISLQPEGDVWIDLTDKQVKRIFNNIPKQWAQKNIDIYALIWDKTIQQYRKAKLYYHNVAI